MFSRISQANVVTSLRNSTNKTKHLNLRQKTNFATSNKPPESISVTTKTSVLNVPPLSEPLPGLPTPIFSKAKIEDQVTQISTLSNGIRVASEQGFGQFCTVGVLIDSGSRYEVAYPSGISHFLEKLAFNSTLKYENKDKILYSLEKLGGICDCKGSRDTLIYAASAPRDGVEEVMQILADIVLRPLITNDEMDIARQTILFDLENLLSRPEQDEILTDMIHAAAYRDNTLGLPKICPEGNVQKIDRKILFTYLKNHHTPKRTVVAGVGIDHDKLVKAVERNFVEQRPIWEEDSSLVLSERASNLVDESIAQYTGGHILDECNVPVYAGPSGLPELSHVVIGLESFPFTHPDFIPMCVLNMMMGGGGSFSAGGPGKGMYTRLYTNVLNRYHWLYSATACNHSYVDAGLFCIHASTTPPHVREMVDVIVQEMVRMTENITNSELSRAKKQLQSMLLMNLEQRPIVFEDIGRQVLSTGERKRPEYFIQAIDNVTRDDIKRVAHRVLKSPPSVAARGEVKSVPSLANIQAGLVKAQGKLFGSKSRLSMFE